MDCDEVFNYWEPLHFLLYGTGFQTWEYAHEFALRTYAYLMPLVGTSKFYQVLIPYLPAWLWPLLTTNQDPLVTISLPSDGKVPLFLLLRATLAASMAFAELSFCHAIMSQKSETVRVMGLTTAVLMLFSAGMSHASGALLPSSTLTMLWLLAAAAFLKHQHILFAFWAIAATLAIGWPFGVLMFVPLGLVVLVRERARLIRFVFLVAVLAASIQGVVMAIDRKQYGKWVSPTWNILIYNTQAGGDELYGIEPWSYYVKNLALNFNYVSALGVASFPLLLLLRRDDTSSLLFVLLPMYVWLGVVFPRPHKEERFLFPIYPCICLGAAMLSVSLVDFLWRMVLRNKSSSSSSSSIAIRPALLIQALLWSPAVIISLSRTLALATYYTAPLQVYSQFQHHPDVTDSVICTCGEWYRFPSSFYLPSTIQSFGFVQSSFEGQLPQPFSATGSRPNNQMHFNDQNRPEPSTLTLIDECDYLVDLFSSNDCRENDSIWKPIALAAFLDADRTSSTLHRALYIPTLHEREEARGSVEYVDYILYQRQE